MSAVEVRRARLSPPEPLPPPAWLRTSAGTAGDLPNLVAVLRDAVAANGAAAVQLDRALTTGEFLDFGAAWGEPLPEHAPEVQPFVEHGCVLNVVAQWDGNADVERQPFSTAPILLHSEGSRRPVDDQPRYLLFTCLEPPDPQQGGQTVLVRMDAVAERLAPDVDAVLRRVRYAGGDGMPTLLRTSDGRDVFSFRDFGGEPLEVSCDSDMGGGDVGDGEVGRAVDALLEALYERAAMTGLSWSRHLVVVLDNHRLFHGRTAMRDDCAGSGRRWLRRIRAR